MYGQHKSSFSVAVMEPIAAQHEFIRLLHIKLRFFADVFRLVVIFAASDYRQWGIERLLHSFP